MSIPGPSVHRIEISNITGLITRDGIPVKITRVDNNTLKIGCTTVTVVVLKKLIQLQDRIDILQDGE